MSVAFSGSLIGGIVSFPTSLLVSFELNVEKNKEEMKYYYHICSRRGNTLQNSNIGPRIERLTKAHLMVSGNNGNTLVISIL